MCQSSDQLLGAEHLIFDFFGKVVVVNDRIFTFILVSSVSAYRSFSFNVSFKRHLVSRIFINIKSYGNNNIQFKIYKYIVIGKHDIYKLVMSFVQNLQINSTNKFYLVDGRSKYTKCANEIEQTSPVELY